MDVQGEDSIGRQRARSHPVAGWLGSEVARRQRGSRVSGWKRRLSSTWVTEKGELNVVESVGLCEDKGRMNALIISELDVLRRTCTSEEAGVHKARQYAAAIKTIRGLTGEIKTLADVPTGKGTGIGTKIQEKIEEILATGSLASAERARATKAPDVLDVFQNIYGVGPKKAADLVAAGYTSLEALATAAALPANAKLLNKNQRIGLRYYADLLERIPRAEMDEHNAVLMARKPAALEGIVVGSYRRGRPDSGDIDMMICTRSAEVDAESALRDYVKVLQDAGYIKEVLALGPHKCLAICQLAGKAARRLDLLVTPPGSFACSVFYFTGSDGFNVAVRALAKEKGFTLNEHGLFPGSSSGVAVAGLKTERDIFTALGLQWKEPAERTGPEAVVAVAVSASNSSSSTNSASSASSASTNSTPRTYMFGRVATMPKGSLRMSTAAAIIVSSMCEEDYDNDDSDHDDDRR